MPLPSYSKEWLKNWLFSNPEFHRIYDLWVLSDFDSYMKPSVDRINDYVSYTEYNIQLMTWKENCFKLYEDKKQGRNNKISNAVCMYSKDGELIEKFHSLSEAERKTSISRTNISLCCKGIRKRAGGFTWKFSKEVSK